MERWFRRPRPEVVALLARVERGEISRGQAAVEVGVDPATIARWQATGLGDDEQPDALAEAHRSERLQAYIQSRAKLRAARHQGGGDGAGARYNDGSVGAARGTRSRPPVPKGRPFVGDGRGGRTTATGPATRRPPSVGPPVRSTGVVSQQHARADMSGESRDGEGDGRPRATPATQGLQEVSRRLAEVTAVSKTPAGKAGARPDPQELRALVVELRAVLVQLDELLKS